MYKLRDFVGRGGMRFYKDPDPDPDPDNKDGGGGGGDPDNKDGEGDNKNKPTGDETYEIKVDGQMVTLTMDELKAKASEASGAQKKFEQASEQMKKAQGGLRVQELGQKFRTGTPSEEEVREYMTLMGASQTEIIQMQDQLKGAKNKVDPNDNKNDDKNKNNSGDDGKGTPPSKITLEQLSPEVRAVLDAADKADLARVRTTIEDQVRQGVDKDTVLSKIVGSIPDTAEQQKVKDVLYEMANESVRGRILGKEAFGADMIADTIQKLRARVGTFGTPTKAAGQPPITGLSPTGTGLAAEVLADEPIKRVASTETNYEDNAVKRLQQSILKAFNKNQRRR